jgi:Hemerythrin HHE cation binding domain
MLAILPSFSRGSMRGVDSAFLAREHRALDELFGRFLGAAATTDVEAAGQTIAAFDDALSRHTAFEEEHVLQMPTGHKLVPTDAEADAARLHRELRLEHVQVRELAAMMRRLLEEKGDLAGALRIAPNLARRWDAHTAREEKELFPALS